MNMKMKLETDHKNLKTALYLDDIRTPSETLPGYNNWVVVRSYSEFYEYLLHNGLPDLISFDHDLADEHIEDYFNQMQVMGWQSPNYEKYKEKTGLDCAKAMCEVYELSMSIDEPDSQSSENFPICVVHSHNPVGAENIKSYISGYIKHYGIDSVCYEQRFPFTYIERVE